jgi:predicted porin
MKKSLVALAALAASAAFAQSTVTLSGTVDLGLEKQSATGALQMTTSASGTTNFTMSGSEDLGNGLKANFKVSTSFDGSYLATGVNYVNQNDAVGTKYGSLPPVIGNNDMFVELAGGFGSLKLGRSLDPVFATIQTVNGTKGVTGFTSKNNILDGNGVYIANQVLFTTPTVSGLSAQLSFAASELRNTKNNTGASVNYAAGPLSIGFATSTVNTNGASGLANLSSSTAANATLRTGFAVQTLSGAYDAGVAKIFVTGTQRAEAKGSYNLGVSDPMGAGMLWADYTANNNTVGAITDAAATQLGYKYSLSKRTTAYAQFGTKKVAGATTQGYGLGVQHNF